MKVRSIKKVSLIGLTIYLAFSIFTPNAANAGKPIKVNPYCYWAPGPYIFDVYDPGLGEYVYYFNVKMYMNPGSVPGGTNNVANTMIYVGNNAQQSVLTDFNFNKSTDFVTNIDYGANFYGNGLNSGDPLINPISQVTVYYDYMGKNGRRIGTSGPVTCSQQSW